MRFGKFLTVVSVLALLGTPAYADTLTEALAKAYNSNPDLAAARAALRAADESAPQARAGYRPTVTASASASRTTTDNKTLTDDDYTSKVAQLSIQQPLFRGGRTSAAISQADSLIAAQRAVLVSAEQQVMMSGVEAYLNVLRDQSVLDLNKNNEAVLTRQLRATKDRFSVGEVTRTDVSQAEARLSGATAARVQAEGALESSKAAYERLFGEKPSNLKKPIDAKLNLLNSLDELIEAAQANSPAVQAALNSNAAANAALDGVKGERLPTIVAEGTLRRSYDNGSSSYDRQDAAVAGVGITWPLYEAGATSSRIREAKQTLSRRGSELESAKRGAIETATKAWEQYQTSIASRTSRQSQVSAAQIALDGVREEANVGNRTVLDTLNAEQELLDARVGLVRAEHDEILSQYQLLAAIGHLTARELQLPVEYYDETAYSNRVRSQWIGSGVE